MKTAHRRLANYNLSCKLTDVGNPPLLVLGYAAEMTIYQRRLATVL